MILYAFFLFLKCEAGVRYFCFRRVLRLSLVRIAHTVLDFIGTYICFKIPFLLFICFDSTVDRDGCFPVLLGSPR